MGKVRLGIIGCGNALHILHKEGLTTNPDIEIVAACDTEIKRAEQVRDEFGLDTAYSDYNELLKRDDVDAVDIIMPTFLHAPVLTAALNAGKHAFCEKPDALNAKEFQAVVDAADRAGKVCMVMRNTRYNPAAQYAKKCVLAGDLGDIYFAKCGWIRRRGIPGKGGWITTKALAGGGPLIDLGVHIVDLAIWLMGYPKPVSVSGQTFCKFADNDAIADSFHARFGEKKADGIFDVEDMAVGMVRFENGAVLQLEISWASNIQRETRYVDLYGDKAGCKFDDGEVFLFGENHRRLVDIVPQIPATGNVGHAECIANFINVINGVEEPYYTLQQGIDLLKILDAIYESAEKGCEIKLD